MLQFHIKAGDVLPELNATLLDVDGLPLNLSVASSVTLRVRQVVLSGSPVKWAKPCTIAAPAAGKVSFAWAAGDTATPGTYEVEFLVTWADGGVQAVPNNGNAVIKILPTLA